MKPETKDVNAFYLSDPDNFAERFKALLEGASAPPDEKAEAAERKATASKEAWPRCKDLARRHDILAEFVASARTLNVVGETRALGLLYLAMTSRVLPRPVSAVVKGASASGKSFLVEQVSRHLPEPAYLALTSMSEKALAYTNEPIANRAIIVYEAKGFAGEFASYLMRTLMTEGDVRHLTVESTEGGFASKSLYVEGPISLITTTTLVSLNPENDNRMLSIPMDDSCEQTGDVMLVKARSHGKSAGVDVAKLSVWQDLQTWLEGANHNVVIPYAEGIAVLTPPVVITLRRTFPMLLRLIHTHAMLHQASRKRDSEGQIIATFEDYDRVRSLVGDLIARGSNVMVSTQVRETVDALRGLLPASTKSEGISIGSLATKMQLDRSTVDRRVKEALALGYVENIAPQGKTRRLVLGEPIPADGTLFPTVDELKAYIENKETSMDQIKTSDPIAADPETGEVLDQETTDEPQACGRVETAGGTPSPPIYETCDELDTDCDAKVIGEDQFMEAKLELIDDEDDEDMERLYLEDKMMNATSSFDFTYSELLRYEYLKQKLKPVSSQNENEPA
jgi:hypothetical protein